MPYFEDCMEFGKELSTWFAERILNQNQMCDWDKGTCDSLIS